MIEAYYDNTCRIESLSPDVLAIDHNGRSVLSSSVAVVYHFMFYYNTGISLLLLWTYLLWMVGVFQPCAQGDTIIGGGKGEL